MGRRAIVNVADIVPVGEKITFVANQVEAGKRATAKVVGGNTVEYYGKVMTLPALTQILRGKDYLMDTRKTYKSWEYAGMSLKDLREDAIAYMEYGDAAVA